MKIITLSTFFFLCISTAVFAQTNDSNQSIRIKAIDSSAKFNKDFSFKLYPIKGLTNKNIRPSFNFRPLTDFSKKPSGVDITAKKQFS